MPVSQYEIYNPGPNIDTVLGHAYAESDARLFAASHKMLDLLKQVMEYADNGTPIQPGSLLIEEIARVMNEENL